jgi:hypothetical protein
MPIDRGRIARGWTLAVLLAAGALAMVGCPGRLENKERFLGTGGGPLCPDVPADILAGNCGGTGCHGPVEPASNLDLQSPGLAGRIVGLLAGGCEGVLADPEDPEGSILYQKLLDSPPCGVRMPYESNPLSEYEIACVKEWISIQNPVPIHDAGPGDAEAEDGSADGGD